MGSNTFLLYGAYGYTGELIARYADQYGLSPILAGRRAAPLTTLSAKLGFPYRTIDLDDAPALQAALQDVEVVVNAAGPFDRTARQIVEACLQTNTHYLDLNGDLEIFGMIYRYNEAAKQAGIMLLPGAGFDVVPTDCLAMFLKNMLPDAVDLKLAFTILGSSLSHGTAVNTIEKLGLPGFARVNGGLVNEPVGEKAMWVDFGGKRIFVVSLPWGDVATAGYSTGIPNIRTYTNMPRIAYWLLKGQSLFNWLLRSRPVRALIKYKIDNGPAGPGDVTRTQGVSYIWGRVTNAMGQTVTARLRTPEAYDLTAYATLLITQKILQGQFTPGFQTPATAYGENLVMELPRVQRDVM
ncbi:MAG TPA: saccharopine dehydrogenase NADP-binding domain-containing protein [Chitinophaga sp.]|uniref:saccharopine dehydrogenase family protein n=1 Tax=Chitinophaga sp. TaxID=1869181 RepID=UPI002DB8A282|nr:saccharopine dehydrogenase NADP-binding domain-containing protein [Chitinophaga sp.]HEU4552586.1 saccharopine dehydrogenase NADP-binding domain-containing protein [Chitinophaga sp.]